LAARAAQSGRARRFKKFDTFLNLRRKLPLSKADRETGKTRLAFEAGEFPYRMRIGEKFYLRQTAPLQVEPLTAQNAAKEIGQGIVVRFEGCDATGQSSAVSASWVLSIGPDRSLISMSLDIGGKPKRTGLIPPPLARDKIRRRADWPRGTCCSLAARLESAQGL